MIAEVPTIAIEKVSGNIWDFERISIYVKRAYLVAFN